MTFNTLPQAGGAEKQFFLVAKYINRLNADNAFVVGARFPGLSKTQIVAETKVVRLPLWPWMHGLRQLIATPLYLVSLIAWLLHNRARYDCILVGAYDISAIAVGVACSLIRRPFVLRYASLADIDILRRSFIGRAGMSLLTRAEHIVINNESARDIAKRRLKFRSEAITLIANGFELPVIRSSRRETRRALGLPDGRTVFINVSSFHVGKNQEAIIAAWPLLRARWPASLILVGDGERMDRSRALVDPSFGDDVHFLGRRDDIFELLLASDIFLYPSIYPEGTPNALIEAMAAELPCIVNDTPQNRALIEDGINGIVCRFDMPEALLAQVERVLTSSNCGSDLGAQAQKRVQTDYAATLAGQRHVRLLETVLESYKERISGVGPAHPAKQVEP